MEWDGEAEELSFWNGFLRKRTEVVPTTLPPSLAAWEPRRDANGAWYYLDPRTGEVSLQFVPETPEGWVVDWSPSQQSWFWKDVRTGAMTLEPPRRESTVNELVEALVEQLQQAGVLPTDAVLSEEELRKSYRRWMKENHPDKRAGDTKAERK